MMYDASTLDTIVVPARPKGFQEVFLTERRWPNLKIDEARRGYVKYIAVYQTAPISAITHYGEIDYFEPLPQRGRFNVALKGEPIEVRPVKFTAVDIWAVQGPRYTTLKLILEASHLARAFPT